jgi:hypothetical protein
MLKSYKIFAGNMIVESDNAKELKVQLLNFIKSATEPQVKNFILNGTVMENIKEKDITNINEQFEKAYIQEGILKTILGVILLTPGGWAIWRMLGAMMNKSKAKCGVIAIGSKRDLCLATSYMDIEKKRIAMLQKESKNCKQAKNPEKCMGKIKDIITKSQKKIQKYQLTLKKATMKGKDVAGAKEKARTGGEFKPF